MPATTSRLTKTTAAPSAAARGASPVARAPADQPRAAQRPPAGEAAAERRTRGRAQRARQPSSRTRSSAARSAAPRAARSRPRRRGARSGRPGIVLGSVIMKNRKTRISGEKASTRQKYQSETGPTCQRAVIAWPLAASTAMHATNETQKPIAIPKRCRRRRIASPPATMIAIAEHEPRRHRAPPELERVGELGAEEQEAEDEPEVRGVEDVTAPEDDQVLREQRDGRGRREDPPAVRAPPVAVLGARHAEDEGDAVPGQQRARRPEDHVLAPERDPHLEHRAGQQRDQDLRDREPEVERDLPEDLQRDDHRGEVEPRVPQRGQQNRIGRAPNPDRRLTGRGWSAHRRSWYSVAPRIP